MNPSVAETARAFLDELGLASVAHSGRTFLDHLLATEALLRRWDVPERVAIAGLFHSIYGTEHFRRVSVSFEERPRVRAAIGEDAERLAFLFCALRRASLLEVGTRGGPSSDQSSRPVRALDGTTVDVSEAELTDLIAIYWANELEQAPRMKRGDSNERARAQVVAALGASRHRLTTRAIADLETHYGSPPQAGAPPIARRPGLAALLDNEDSKRLLAVWPGALATVNGPVERLAGLADYEFDELIALEKSKTTASFIKPDGSLGSVDVHRGQERTLYDGGLTLQFHGIRSPRLNAWVDALDAELALVTGRTLVHATAGRRRAAMPESEPGRARIVCQGRGVWRGRLDGKEGLVELGAGAVAFLPDGIRVSTEATGGPSVQVSVEVEFSTWRSALEELAVSAFALDDDRLRVPLIQALEGDRLPNDVLAELEERQRPLFRALRESDLESLRRTLRSRGGKRRRS